MKALGRGQLRRIIEEELDKRLAEATGGDGKFERVDGTNWQHLEVGNLYVCKVGREKVKATFQDWVDEHGNKTESEDPEQVKLKFADDMDGMEWEAYWFEGRYCGGSSAETLSVKEVGSEPKPRARSIKLLQRVQIKSGMPEFVGATGVIVGTEMDGRTKMYRVRLDRPVQTSIGSVKDDLWAAEHLKALKEGKRLSEADRVYGRELGGGELWEVTADVLLEFAKKYASLGSAVTEQVGDLLDGSYDEVNRNSAKMIERRLGGINRELDEALGDYDVWVVAYENARERTTKLSGSGSGE